MELPFTHVTRDEGEESLHVSNLHQYVSAYRTSKETVDDLVSDLCVALDTAKITRERQIVDQDGEMFFVVYPAGTISLCLRWKTYKVADDETTKEL